MKKLSMVIPMYYEEEVVNECYTRLEKVLGGLENYDYEIIFVNDGSKDKTLELLTEIANKNKKVKILTRTNISNSKILEIREKIKKEYHIEENTEITIKQFEDMYQIAEDVPAKAKLLSNAFWPGPLTIIVKKGKAVPYETTGGLDTVAVRMPAHKTALALIRESGCLIAAPSANKSGRPSPTLAAHVKEDLNVRIPLILDGGEVGSGGS